MRLRTRYASPWIGHSGFGFFTVERYWNSFRTSCSYQLERGGGTLVPSHVLQLDYPYSPRNSIGVSFANGREFADFGSFGVLNTVVRNVIHGAGRC